MFIDAAGTDCLRVHVGIGLTTSTTRGVDATVSLYQLLDLLLI